MARRRPDKLILAQCAGINNKVTPARIRYDSETGVSDLETGTDVLIDMTGGITTRRGSDLVETGVFHSGFPKGDGTFYVVKDRTTDSAIYKVTPATDGNVTLEGIASGYTKGARFEFREVKEEFYFMNGYEKGVLIADAPHSWPLSVWPRSTTAQFITTPTGSHFDIISGSFVVAIDNELFFTESGVWGVVDNSRNYRRAESEIVMVCAVDTGVFFSDRQAVYFLEGRNPSQWSPAKVLNYPAIPYCKAPTLVDPSQHGFETTAPSALFGTTHGPVMGLPDGSCVNMINKKVKMPSGISQGAIMVVDETTIIQSGV